MSRRLQAGLTAGLTTLGLIYLIRGYAMLWLQRDLSDMTQRAVGLAYIRAGSPPFNSGHDTVADAPWGWLGNAVIFWPPEPWSRVYFGLLILGIVVLLWRWGYQAGEAAGPGSGPMLASATLAISSVCTALGLGQNSPVMVAALVGCYLLAVGGHRVGAGICLGFAMAKPQISLLFALPFLVGGDVIVLAVAAGYMVMAGFTVGWLAGISPREFVQQWLTYIAEAPLWPGYGPYQLLVEAGMAQPTALSVTAVVIGGIALVAVFVLRRQPLILQFAIVAVAARLWSYHQLYDNIMLVFLLIAAGDQAIRGRDWRSSATFLAVGVTVWIPGRMCDLPAVQWFQMTVWVFAAITLARSWKTDRLESQWRARATPA